MVDNNQQKLGTALLPSDNVQLNHLYPKKLANIIVGYWEPGKKFISDHDREKKVIVIDEIGQFVWNLCDGTHSVRTIEKKLIEDAEQDTNSVRSSLATFLLNLKKKGYISLDQE